MLTIDVGNSRIKGVCFQGREIVSHHVQAYSADSFEAALEAILSNAETPLEKHSVFVSHVAGEGLKKRLISVLDGHSLKNVYFAQTQVEQCGVLNSYTRPEDMGVDRWLAMIAGFHHPLKSPQDGVCVIDCGTAITLDVVDYQGKHSGGLIMPGFQTMYGALISSARRIQMDKKMNPETLLNTGLASSTELAVKKGCQQMMIEGLSGIIVRQAEDVKGALHCLVTGGDGEWVSESLACHSIHEPFLVHYGLRIVADELSHDVTK